MKSNDKIIRIRQESGLDHRKFADLLNGHSEVGAPKMTASFVKRFEEGEYIGYERSQLITDYLTKFYNFQSDSDHPQKQSTFLNVIKRYWLEIVLLLVAASYILVSVIFSFQNFAEIILGVTAIVGLIALRDIVKKRS